MSGLWLMDVAGTIDCLYTTHGLKPITPPCYPQPPKSTYCDLAIPSNSRCRIPPTIATMDQRRAPEYIIEVFASPESVKDVVRGSV